MSVGRPSDTDQTRALCNAYRQAVANGDKITELVAEWAEMLGVQRPAIWKRLRAGGALPPYEKRKEGGGVPSHSRAKPLSQKRINKESRDNAPRIHRDPCPRCGVRADIGCCHSHNRLGVSFS